ncbi:hypothetical protein BJF93_19310 [Xaviernesmea oryzae]|uniref:Uncharacterized protein n=1 Tax=Xaviernesmea oryzae TaxID=464029 RepID=A0A1Q9B1D9_9HYPH|nr:hypothetical protein [Xaviernesmea oryzae]OLP61839.1 hypothetical protein BJF93_19310 [Xaviernesmea oryzae]SEL75886.1 hypothetical protein SAMN04487976_11279 [Xaviernesmea oryzae]
MRIESQSIPARALLAPTPEAAASVSISVQAGVARYAAAPPLPVASPSSRLSSALFDMQVRQQFGGEDTEADSHTFSRTEHDYMDWSKKSLAEKIRAQVLEENGLTEESLRMLPEDKQHEILDEIKERIRLAQTANPRSQTATAAKAELETGPALAAIMTLLDHPGFATAA